MRIVSLVILALLFAPVVACAAAVTGDHIGISWWGTAVGLMLAVGIVLGGYQATGNLGTELSAITRRAFIPRLIVQTGRATPVLGGALANANMCSGGISSVTAPVQGAPLVTPQAVGYDGAFNAPADLVGITNAEFNLKAMVVPIPFFGMEGLIQLDAAVIPKIAAKMNDVGNQLAAYLSTQMFLNDADDLDIAGFVQIAATTGTYGNISKTDNLYWRGFSRARGNVAPTRATVLNDIISVARNGGGEKPNIGVLGPGTWSKLSEDFLPQERYNVTDGMPSVGESGFMALMVGGVPIFIDFDQTEGELLLFNNRYDGFYIHEAAAYSFTGFASTLPNNQLGYIGAVVAAQEHVNVKPNTVGRITGYTFNAVS